MRLKDKVAIITGGGSGIDRAISLRYGAEGASVVVADVNVENAKKVADEIINSNGHAIGIAVDVRKKDQVQAMVDTTVSHFGSLDILVNNAGTGKILPFFETTEADWDMMFDVNCKGLLFCSQTAAKQMIAHAIMR